MTKNLDGIIGPNGECTCNHCQTNNMIDGIVARDNKQFENEPYELPEEADDDQTTVPVVQQLAE